MDGTAWTAWGVHLVVMPRIGKHMNDSPLELVRFDSDGGPDGEAVNDSALADEVVAPTETPAPPEPKTPEIPSDRLAIRTGWGPSSYGELIRGSGARKLAQSSVAPLIAASRGYMTIAEPKDITAFRRRRSIPKAGNDKVRRELADLLNDGDMLGMPWFRLDHVLAEGTSVRMSTSQYRPEKPMLKDEYDENGVPTGKYEGRKYLNEAGDSTTLDTHPAIPVTWGEHAPRVLVIEGLLKADAALTHLLLTHGVTEEELSVTDRSVADLRTYLQTLLDRVPEAERMFIVAAVGVGNWHGANEWNSLRLRDRTAYIAFDADMGTKLPVWTQGDKMRAWLESKHAAVRFLRLDDPDFSLRVMDTPSVLERVGVDKEGNPKRLGLDDFLANVGTWTEALESSTVSIPERPVDGTRGYGIGDFRVLGRYGEFVAECVPLSPGSREKSWERRVSLGARIRSIRSGRVPTQNELITSRADESLSGDTANSEVEIEFNWVDPNTKLHREAIVRGPSEILMNRPEDWARKGARIPPEILRHPEWPPMKHSADWLHAIKAHREEEVDMRTGWSVMGWVPSVSGSPAYVIGNQVLAEEHSDELDIAPGVTEEELPGATRYGVDDYYGRLLADSADGQLSEAGMAEYKRQVREDIREVIAMFFDSGAFGRADLPAVIVGAMLRPACPPKPQATVMFWGPPAGGKSYASAAVMGGWRSGRRSWNENSLPGQAGDTAASHELAVSMTPIWVADDLAPSTDRGQAERQEAAIGTLIRNVFNGAPKRRTEQGRTMRESNEPRALLVATAENEPTIDSVRDRSIMVQIGQGTFAPDAGDAIDKLRSFFTEGEAPPRLTAAMIRYWFHGEGMSEMDWQSRVEVGESIRRGAQKIAEEYIHDVSKVKSHRAGRHAKLASELAMSFKVLEMLALWAGIEEQDPLIERLRLRGEKSLVRPLLDMMAGSLRRQAKSTPGSSLVAAVNALLSSGNAHLANPDDAGAPPFAANQGGNEALGWRFDSSRGAGEGAWVPCGTRIGYLTELSAKDPTLVALLMTEDAFGEAKRRYPNLLPHGAGLQAAWPDVWAQGYAAGRAPKSGFAVQVTARAPNSGADGVSKEHRRIRGVPVLLEALRDPEAFASRISSTDGTSEDEDETESM